MAQPSVAITRLDLSMTYKEFSLRANRMKFGWTKILPPLQVGNLSQSEFPRINLSSLLENVDQSDERDAYSTYARDTFEWEKDSYSLKEHGREETVDDQLIEMYGDIIDAELIARNRAIDYVLRRLEQEVANTLFTNTWPAGYQTAITTPWSTSASAKPIDDLYAAIEKVEDRIGITPNKLIISDRTWRDLKLCQQFEDKLDMGSNNAPNQISKEGFLSLFDDLDEIIVVAGYTNTAHKGQVPALGRVWDSNMAMVARCSSGAITDNDLTGVDPHLGRVLFHQAGGGIGPGMGEDEQALMIEEYREEQRRGGVVRARNYRQIKMLHQACGELLTGVAS